MNKKIQRILACVDFSDYSVMVLEHAMELAMESYAQVILYNVINQRDITNIESLAFFAPEKITVKEFIADQKISRLQMMKELIKKAGFEEKTCFSFKIDVGVPFEKILEIIEEKNIDLIVMANQGKGNIARVLFGSVAEKLFRHSPVPVVSVRDRKTFKREK
jgi:nucleotide-binding universal stress UspA family protein